jgi:hypothetical protein
VRDVRVLGYQSRHPSTYDSSRHPTRVAGSMREHGGTTSPINACAGVIGQRPSDQLLTFDGSVSSPRP